MKVLFFKSNKTPVLEFIRSLEIEERARILACLKSMEDLGIDYCPRVQFRQIKGKLWEIKIKASKSDYRIFYAMVAKNTIVLLHAYKKQSQKAPAKEIKIAEKRLFEVLENENHYTH